MSKRLPFMDSLRGIAVALVFVAHSATASFGSYTLN